LLVVDECQKEPSHAVFYQFLLENIPGINFGFKKSES